MSKFTIDLMVSLLDELGYSQGLDDQGQVIATVADLRDFGERLSKLSGKTPPWSYNYMRNILNGKLTVSQALAEAVQMMALSMDGKSPVTVNKEAIVVMADPEKVKPNAVILADSRPCANPICSIEFVPKIWNQKYCCPDCGVTARKIKAGKYDG